MKVLITLVLVLRLNGLLEFERAYLDLINTFPSRESKIADDYLVYPYDLAIYNNTLYIADASDNCIKVFSIDGKFLNKIGKKGSGPGELLSPFVITVNKKLKEIYCWDSGNHQISVYGLDGSFRRIIKTSLSIWDLDCSNNYLYASAFNEKTKKLFLKYDMHGKILTAFGDLFDDKVKKPRARKFLYGQVQVVCWSDSVYAFFERLPLIQVFSNDGRLVRSIELDLASVREEVTDYFKGKRKRLPSVWLWGAFIEQGRFFCYIRDKRVLVQFNGIGKATYKYFLSRSISDETAHFLRFVGKIRNSFIFIDRDEAQIKIFRTAASP